MNMPPSIFDSQAVSAALEAAGFTRRGTGPLRRGPLTATCQDGWLAFEPFDVDTLHLPQLSLGKGGLWKPRGLDAYAFEVPLAALGAADVCLDDEDGAGEQVVEDVAAWCEATLVGEPAADWVSPDEDAVSAWLPAEARAVRQGALVRRIELICSPRRLALRAVLVSEVPASLSAARRTWIERKLLFAQRQWRLVRLGFDCGTIDKPAIAAEADLTGCPTAICRELLLASVSALQQVGAHELLTLSVLCDHSVACQAWEEQGE